MLFDVISNEKSVKRFTFFVNKKRDECDVYLSVGGDRVNCGPLTLSCLSCSVTRILDSPTFHSTTTTDLTQD